MATFFDTHAHLDDSGFAADLPGLVERARLAGISTMITMGTDLASSRRAVELAGQFSSIYAAAGWHPSDAPKASDDVRPELRELARHPKVTAIGEIGLDYYRMPKLTPQNALEIASAKKKQAQVFEQQLQVAAETGLNCVIHARSAMEDAMAMIRPYAGRLRCVFHCFSDGPEVLKAVLNLGAMVSFTGILTYKNTEALRAAIAMVPADRFMLETDCPYLAPVPYRGKRCEPSFLRETAAAVAEVRGCSLVALSECTCDNARRFFHRLKV